MTYIATTATHKIANLKSRIRVVQGGTSASKTVSIILYLIDYAQTHEGKTVSIVSESMPHIKKGAMKDFLDIMRTHGYYSENDHNKTDNSYTFPTGTTVEFYGVDSPDKVRGPRRDVLFMNECNNIHYNTFDQMEVRTREFVFLDFNPVGEFWVHTNVMNHFEYDFVKLTYKDNEGLDEQTIKSIESRKHNENWWRVYGEGEIGINEGQIYTNWEIIDAVPKEAELKGYGLDFGYTNDPTAIVAVYYVDNSYVLDEVAYATGLSNQDIASVLKEHKNAPVICDSAEPKSIAELKRLGINAHPAEKGQGSVNQGIQVVQNERLKVTKTSVSVIKELRNYLWKTDKNGEPMNVPNDFSNHAADAIRYKITNIKNKPKVQRSFSVV